MKKINKGFTLVELIVVITILAVLWTIAFVSFQWYASNSRDSVRLTDLSNISKAIKVKLAAWETLLMPDKSVEIQTNWEVLNYQWLMWEKILSHYWISNGWVDPLDLKPYTYAINKNKNKYQVLAFLENGDYISFLNHKTYADNKQKFHKSVWDTLGILLDPTDNTPLINSWSLLSIDIDTTTESYSVITSNTQGIASWSSVYLKEVLSFRIDSEKSCNNLLLNGLSKWDGLYTIKPNWSDPMRVYCDMTTDNWGWTLAIRIKSDSKDHKNTSKVWNIVKPSLSSPAKLSDTIINQVWGIESTIYKMTCWDFTQYFKLSDNTWNSSGRTDYKLKRVLVSDDYNWNYEFTGHADNTSYWLASRKDEFWVIRNWGTHLDFVANSASEWSWCYQNTGWKRWGQDGLLWVK